MGPFYHMYCSKEVSNSRWPNLPKELSNLYRNNSLKTKLYIKLRWRLCPFFKIEDYIPIEGNILDLGCGLGILSNILAINSEKKVVHGIDKSKSRINEALKTIQERKNVNFFIKDITDIDYNKYDTVILSDFLHHLKNNEQINILKIIYAGLNNESRLIILDVNKNNSLKYYFANFIDFVLNGRKSNFRSIKEWEIIIRDIGFTTENIVDLSMGVPLSDFLITAIK